MTRGRLWSYSHVKRMSPPSIVVGAGHLVDRAAFVPLEGKRRASFGRESGPHRAGRGGAGVHRRGRWVGWMPTVPPSDVVGVGALRSTVNSKAARPCRVPRQLDARPEILGLEHGGGLNVLGPLIRIVREVEVLTVGGESAAHPIQGRPGVGVGPFGLPQDAASGPDVAVSGLLGFRSPLPTGPPSSLQLDAASDDVGAVQHVVRPLALIGHKSDLRRRAPVGQEQMVVRTRTIRTNKFGNGFVAGSGQNLNGCCPRGCASRWPGRCCRATRGIRIRPRAWAPRTSG